ncbi:outer membrane protein [Arenimonas oryziterrae]|uniref:Outer membrane protein beta-barrel domain-containing protein n=1 Tax=Arenimonas oryziterrae DSM 21050 = YC6267 TaxID=1121015 RepID=A0A091AWC7_9GAMM|nr:outer membrane beta-barrel protein [Arenimonas oryziterrae]KFN44603.1 hypothetical protein N789_00930 [Arenimonas oryziterrae DSM 21050 = YC6267]
MRSLIYASLALALFSTSASAADSWTGFYAGANAGRANGDSRSQLAFGGNWAIETPAFRDEVRNTWSTDLDPSGFTGGVQAGYDHQFNNRFVLGVEFDINSVNLDETRLTPPTSVSAAPSVTYSYGNSIDTGRALSLRPRFGVAFDNNTLLYLTGGWTRVKVEGGAEILSNANYSKIGAGSKTLNGTIWGIGVEHRFGNSKWSGKLEYLRSKLDDFTFATTYRAGSSFPGYSETVTQDLSYRTIRVGFNYRF